MGSSHEHPYGGKGCEEAAEDEADPVNHHGGELPVRLQGTGLVVVLDLVGAQWQNLWTNLKVLSLKEKHDLYLHMCQT